MLLSAKLSVNGCSAIVLSFFLFILIYYHILYIFRQLAVALFCNAGKQQQVEYHNTHSNLQRKLSYHILGKQFLKRVRNYCIFSNLFGLDFDTWDTLMVQADLPCHIMDRHLNPAGLVYRSSGRGVCIQA